MSSPEKFHCGMCNRSFTTKLALQSHMASHVNAAMKCNGCQKYFPTTTALNDHKKAIPKCGGTVPKPVAKIANKHECTLCNRSFSSTDALMQHRRTIHSFVHGGQLSVSRALSRQVTTSRVQSLSQLPTSSASITLKSTNSRNMNTPPIPPASSPRMNGLQSNNEFVNANIKTVAYTCDKCHRSFQTMLAFNAHVELSCRAASNGKATTAAPSQRRAIQPPLNAPSLSNQHSCSIIGCPATFRSEAALKVHKIDAHSIGGTPLNPNTRGMRRSDIANATSLHSRPPLRGSASVHGNQSFRGGSQALGRVQSNRLQATTSGLPPYFQAGQSTLSTIQQVPYDPVPDLDQAKEVTRLMTANKLTISPILRQEGYVTYIGNNFSRVPCHKQDFVVDMLNKECHLPSVLQSVEYFPRLFSDESFNGRDNFDEFATSPTPDANNPKLKAVLISCHKLRLEDGSEEVSFLSAIDMLTSRVLLSNIVSPFECNKIVDWRSHLTGISSYDDLTSLISKGYAVLKGWRAAREALWAFVDADTLILGLNVRPDLDALRMIHGRGVDFAIMMRKAAGGPMGKTQLSLDSLTRELLKDIKLKNYQRNWRDCLEDAFTIRQLFLHSVKPENNVRNWAKQRSLEHQRAHCQG